MNHIFWNWGKTLKNLDYFQVQVIKPQKSLDRECSTFLNFSFNLRQTRSVFVMARWFLLAIFGAFIAQTFARTPQLEKVAPIVWQKSSLTPITGYEYRTHLFSFGDPCNVFNNNEFSLACKKQGFGDNIAHAMKTYCPQIETLQIMPNRDVKKQDKPFFNEISSSITGVISHRLPVELVNYWKPTLKLSPWELKKEMDHVYKIKNTEHNVEEKSVLLKPPSPWTEIISSVPIEKSKKLEIVLKEYENKFVKFLEGIKEGRVYEVYNEIFPNITENPEHRVPVELWSFENCYSLPKNSQYNGELVLWFKIPVRAPGIETLRSKKFNIVKQEKNQQCLYSYDQKQNLVRDTKNNCLKEFDDTAIVNNKMVLFSADHHNCPTFEAPETKWTKKHCYDGIHPIRYQQRMEDPTHHYIYCLDQTMIVLGYDGMKCENVVYRIPHTQQFWLDGEEIRNGSFFHEAEFEIEHNLTDFLNERTFTRAFGNLQKLDDLGDIIRTEQEMNHSMVLGYVFTHPVTLLTLGLSMLLMTVVFIALLFLSTRMYSYYCYRSLPARFWTDHEIETVSIAIPVPSQVSVQVPASVPAQVSVQIPDNNNNPIAFHDLIYDRKNDQITFQIEESLFSNSTDSMLEEEEDHDDDPPAVPQTNEIIEPERQINNENNSSEDKEKVHEDIESY